MFRADLHIHTCFSFDCDITPEQIVQRCLKLGISCVAITDHGKIDGALKVKEIAPFKVIIGQEVYTKDGEIMGLFLKKPVPYGLSAQEAAQAIVEQGGIVGIPHPLDRFRGCGVRVVEKLLPWLSFIEVFNARSLIGRDAFKLSRQYNLPGTAGSDAHSLSEIGQAYIELPPFNSAEEFLASLWQGRVNGHRLSVGGHLLSLLHRFKKTMGGRRCSR